MTPLQLAAAIDGLSPTDLASLNAILLAAGYSTPADGDPLNPPKKPPVPPLN